MTPGAGEAWKWRVARALVGTPLPVLHAGHWCLRPVRAIAAEKAERHPVSPMEWGFGQPPMPPHSLAAMTRFLFAWKEDWWESLPEQRPGAVLGLRALSASEDGRVKKLRAGATPETVNRMLLLNFTPDPRGTVSRAWPLPGGRETWRQELSARRRGGRLPLLEGSDWGWLA